MPTSKPEGHHGWDDYARFYDWENARTLGRRDVPFWRTVAARSNGPILVLGCGTGRITLPLGRAGAEIVGIDRSAPMLDRARRRVRRAKVRHVHLIRGDIRFLPFRSSGPALAGPYARATADKKAGLSDIVPAKAGTYVEPFGTVIAPYGILQSLLREADLSATLAAVHSVLKPGGTFGLELVADLPSWEEYKKRVSLRGWRRQAGGSHVTLVETVRQDRARRLTIFDQEFTEREGRRKRVHRFSLTFRTLSVPQMVRRLEKAGFAITALLGDYRGGPWDPRADVWVVLAHRPVD
jgi:SAM-dependent methyltransferase